jgi:hypothetical protein
MPGFGDNPTTKDVPNDGMFTDGMLRAVACYEATLGDDDQPPPGCKGAPLSTTTTLGFTATPNESSLPSTTSTTNEAGD